MGRKLFNSKPVIHDKKKSEHTLDVTRMTASLDSLEQVLYSQFYGIKTIEKKDKVKKKEKKDAFDADIFLADFLKNRKEFVQPHHFYSPLDISKLTRIAKHLSEFQLTIKEAEPDIEDEKRHIRGVSWKNQMKMKLFSEQASRTKPDSDRHRWIGPGSELPEERIAGDNIRLNTGFGISRRFQPCRSTTPGPGTYTLIPKQISKESKSIPSFEWASKRTSLTSDDKLPPNMYNIDAYTIAAKVNRRLTKRGPYDIFTGPRDYTTIKNHFTPAVPIKGETESWPFKLPGMTDNNYKYGYGHWGKSKRLMSVTQNPSYPAPNHYNLEKVVRPKVLKPNIYPFGSSIDWIRGGPLKELPVPGPGRYSST